MRSGDGEATFTIHIVVKYSKDKYKTKGIKYFAYVRMVWTFPYPKLLRSIVSVLE